MIAAIIVGAFSGVLGSVLGPFVTSWLRGREHKQEREREIHAELRQMIEERFADCDREVLCAFRIFGLVRLGQSPMEAYTHALAQQAANLDKVRHRWEPYRIMDESLRQLAEQLSHDVLNFHTHHLSVSTMDLDNWWAEAVENGRSLDDIRSRVRLRLDELRW